MDVPFVGRNGELAELIAAVSAVSGGAGRLVLISGPAGIGKTRLVGVLEQIASAQGVPVARGYAVDDPGMPALWPWRRLARVLAELTEPLSVDLAETAARDSAAARFEMFAGVADALDARARAAGLVLVLEDMHWADPTSLLMLRHVAAEIRSSRILAVATFREPPGPTLAEHLPELMRASGAQIIALDGLSAADVAQLLRVVLPGAADVAERLTSRTDGNPLYIRLLVDAMARAGDPDVVASLAAKPSINPEVRRLVVAQLRNASPGVHGLLGAASVLGEQIAPAVLAEVAQTPPLDIEALLDEAAGAGFVRSAPDGQLGFAHSLVRDAVYEDLAPSTRTLLHRRAAEVLSASAAADSIAGLIASHWQRAESDDARGECARWARTAAHTASTAAAYDEAVRFLRLALDAAGPDPAIIVELAGAEFNAGRIGASLEHSSLAARLGAQQGRADIVAAAALVVHGLGSPQVVNAVDGLCELALRIVPESDLATRARLLAQRSQAAGENDDIARARELASVALELAERSADPDALLDSIAARHYAILSPQTVEERLALARRSVEIATAARHPGALQWGNIWIAEAGLQLGDLPSVDHALRELDRFVAERKLPTAHWHLLGLRASRAALVGDFDRAVDLNEQALQIARRTGDSSLLGLYYAFVEQHALTRGSVDRATADAVLALVRAGPQLPIMQIGAPLMYALLGDLDTARDRFAPFRGLAATTRVGPRWAGLLHLTGALATLLDDAEVAEAV